MMFFKKIKWGIFVFLIQFWVFAQNKTPEFKPYTIETTYQKLKKEYPFISPIQPLISKEIVFKENLVYKNIDNKNLHLDCYSPKLKKNKNLPAVVLIHGGGWLTGSKENERIMAQHLALKGYVAFTVEYRLGLEAPYPAGIIDVKDAIRFVRKHAKKYHVNAIKIAVLGASSGAQMATLIGVTPNSKNFNPDNKISDEIQAIINIDGIVSFIHSEANSEGKMASIWLNGTKETNWKNWKEASALEYVNEQSPPTLFINSSQPRFHAGRDDMMKLLKKYNIYTEMHTLHDSPHSFWLMNPWFEPTLNFTVNFLDNILKTEDLKLQQNKQINTNN